VYDLAPDQSTNCLETSRHAKIHPIPLIVSTRQIRINLVKIIANVPREILAKLVGKIQSHAGIHLMRAIDSWPTAVVFGITKHPAQRTKKLGEDFVFQIGKQRRRLAISNE